MTNRIVFGCDPGASGAVCVFCDGVLDAVVDMPTSARKAGGESVDGVTLGNILRGVRNAFSGASFVAYVEQVSAMPGQGVSSMFRFGESFGRLVGVLQALSIPVVFVTPQAWKKYAGLIGAEKDVARTLAIERFPSHARMLFRKKDIGRADAILLGAYGVEQEK